MAATSRFLRERVSRSKCDGIHSTHAHPSQAVETGSRISPDLVVGLFPEFQAEGGGEHHHKPTEI